MMHSPLPESDLAELMDLLEKRLEVIGDTRMRDSDSDAHLRKLQHVSEAILTFHERHRDNLSPRLNHFLENASYGKALAWAREQREK